jgi:hypothetical protein
MSTLERFMAYAADFEKTYVDDDWSRLYQYFCDDAVYRVESDLFGCELTGPAAIFAGIKKSLDGFDRRFTGREIAITEGPEVDGDELSATWKVTYTKDGLPPFVLRGKSMARMRDGKVALLLDTYDEQVAVEASEWMREAGVEFDLSYV